jgi:hypothetical protein
VTLAAFTTTTVVGQAVTTTYYVTAVVDRLLIWQSVYPGETEIGTVRLWQAARQGEWPPLATLRGHIGTVWSGGLP